MDRSYSPGQEEFRSALRSWLERSLPAGWLTGHRPIPEDPRDHDAFLREWAQLLSRSGWAGVAWPREYGGRGASLVEQIILEEELARCEAPHFVNFVGVNLVGPTLMALGSPEQKRAYLPPILRGDEMWCQGFSEPNAGSDLAALSTRAVQDDERFRMYGQKVWTSFATTSDRCFLLARTGSAQPKHEGITAFLLDMHQPGIDVRPIHQINGNRRFNEVFLDGASASAEDVVGEVGKGWSVAMTMLQFERVALAGQVFALRNSVARLVRTAKRERSAWIDRATRRAIANYVVRARAAEALFYRHLSDQVHGEPIGVQGALDKLVVSELNKEIAGFGIGLLGAQGVLWEDETDPTVARWRDVWLTAIGYTLAGGTSEILRNVIGERVLGLPRDLRY